MSNTVAQISTLLSSLPKNQFGKTNWRSVPKLVARIVKALINFKGSLTEVSEDSGVSNQILYAVMRGKTPDGSKEWKELREALSKMKCEWRGKTSTTTSLVVPNEVTSLMKPEVSQGMPAPEVIKTKPKPIKNRKLKVVKRELSKQEHKFYDFETKELVIVTTVRYAIDAESLTDLMSA